MKTINPAFTMSIKPMRSTGITGQSSKRGTCVTPNTYLMITELVSRGQDVKLDSLTTSLAKQLVD